MKLLLDMNLPTAWCDSFRARGHEVIHWSGTGNPRATDQEIMNYASANGYAVVTYDLDFGALLAATHARGPSVILIRARDVTAATVEALVVAALNACADELVQGAIVTVEEAGNRVRALPLIARR